LILASMKWTRHRKNMGSLKENLVALK
jgi:hypothetical protein